MKKLIPIILLAIIGISNQCYAQSNSQFNKVLYQFEQFQNFFSTVGDALNGTTFSSEKPIPFNSYLKKAQSGDVEAQMTVGIMYFSGRNTEKNEKEGFYWLQQSALKGNAKAQALLGLAYLIADENKSLSDGIFWIQKSAEQKVQEAELMMGLCHIYGFGIEADKAKAAEWFKKSLAHDNTNYNSLIEKYYSPQTGQLLYNEIELLKELAEKGDFDSQLKLGAKYYKGVDVEQDYEKSIYWFKKGAEQGNIQAQYLLGGMYIQGLGTPADTARGIFWLKKSSLGGNTAAGEILAKFISLTKENKSQNDYFKQNLAEAENGNAKAQLVVGALYLSGEGVEQSFENGGYWIQKSAEQGFPEALYAYGRMYLIMKKGDKYVDHAIELYKKSAEAGFAEAAIGLGRMYLEDEYVEKDGIEAVKWFKKAAELGDSNGPYALGIMYYLGREIPKDEAEGKRWLTLAVKKGHEDAKKFWTEVVEKQE